MLTPEEAAKQWKAVEVTEANVLSCYQAIVRDIDAAMANNLQFANLQFTAAVYGGPVFARALRMATDELAMLGWDVTVHSCGQAGITWLSATPQAVRNTMLAHFNAVIENPLDV